MSPSNVQVRTIQNLLRLHGFSPPVNGKLDDITKDYYNNFCCKNNFPQQKYFFNKRKAIKDLTVKLGLELELKSGVGPNKNKAIKEYIKEIQSKLQEKGHKINSDGIWGKNTDEALKEFQKNMGIPPTGEIKPYLYTDVTWLKLMKGNSSKPLNEPTKSALEIIRKYMPYTRVVLAPFFASAPAYKKVIVDRDKIDDIISKLKKKGYGYMYDKLIERWDKVVDAGSKYQYKKVGGKVVEIKAEKEQVEWANNVKILTPKKEDEDSHKYFFWEKVACICDRILLPSGSAFDKYDINPYIFSFNDNNKLLLNLDDKSNHLPKWGKIGDGKGDWEGWKKLKNFKIKDGALPWGTYWSFETLNRIDNALEIEKFYEEKFPGSIKNNKITITSLSPEYGYRLLGSTHKTGLDIDFRIITHDGNRGWLAGYKDKDGNIKKSNSPKYDQEGQRFFLKLLNELNKSKKIKIRLRMEKKDGKDVKVPGKPVFNDKVLIDKKLCVEAPGHYDHVHLQIGKPPQNSS